MVRDKRGQDDRATALELGIETVEPASRCSGICSELFVKRVSDVEEKLERAFLAGFSGRGFL